MPVPDGEAVSTPILLIDDELRRVYVPKAQVTAILDQAPENLVKIPLWQKVAKAGNTLGSVGPSLGVTPFDEFGRRIYEMQTRDGPLSIVQGITEITPRYAKVEGLLGAPSSIVWDMRLATSSIPRETIAAILNKAVSHDDPQDWLQVVRFYLQAERYREALTELEAIIAAFPDKADLQTEVQQLRKIGARRILRRFNFAVPRDNTNSWGGCWPISRPKTSPAKPCSRSARPRPPTKTTRPAWQLSQLTCANLLANFPVTTRGPLSNL